MPGRLSAENGFRVFDKVIVAVVNLPVRKGETLFGAEQLAQFLPERLALGSQARKHPPAFGRQRYAARPAVSRMRPPR